MDKIFEVDITAYDKNADKSTDKSFIVEAYTYEGSVAKALDLYNKGYRKPEDKRIAIMVNLKSMEEAEE
ncbi:MAG: hypothetical protein KAS32_05885 [Candidatus Peribacteraceae bacterium]|nr:hypothetical protein [Candidatus Peribacteraceae bacterium]